jgi:hypothetical protein
MHVHVSDAQFRTVLSSEVRALRAAPAGGRGGPPHAAPSRKGAALCCCAHALWPQVPLHFSLPDGVRSLTIEHGAHSFLRTPSSPHDSRSPSSPPLRCLASPRLQLAAADVCNCGYALYPDGTATGTRSTHTGRLPSAAGVFNCGYSLYRDLNVRDCHLDVGYAWQTACAPSHPSVHQHRCECARMRTLTHVHACVYVRTRVRTHVRVQVHDSERGWEWRDYTPLHRLLLHGTPRLGALPSTRARTRARTHVASALGTGAHGRARIKTLSKATAVLCCCAMPCRDVRG